MTKEKPKTLVEVNGKPMLGYLIDNLIKHDIEDIVVCVGYKSEEIVGFCSRSYPGTSFTFVENTRFDETNNMYSLYLARGYLDREILLMNSDLVFDHEVIEKMIAKIGSCVAVDVARYIDESMKVVVSDGRIVSISKQIEENDSYGCSIDVYKLAKADLSQIIDEMSEVIDVQGDENQWTEVMLDNLFKSGRVRAEPTDIEDARWFEIDNYEDLAKAEILFSDELMKIGGKKIFFVDRDGTLALGGNNIAGAREFLSALAQSHAYLYVLTNNSSKTPSEHLSGFRSLGFDLDIDSILVSTEAAVAYLVDNGLKRIYWAANKEVSEYLEDSGLVWDDDDPQAVLLTYDDQIDYGKIQKIIGFIRSGKPYFATHIDRLCPTPYGPLPDIGAFINVIEMATDVRPLRDFGKPNFSLIEPVLRRHDLTSKDAVIIGDRLYTDIAMAENNDMTSVLVLSGETDRSDYETSRVRSDIVIDDISKLIPYLPPKKNQKSSEALIEDLVK